MAKLLTSIRRPAQGYAIGGVSQLLAIATFENGKNTIVVTPGATASDPVTVDLAAGVTEPLVQIEFEDGGDNVCSFSDNTVMGGNTYVTPVVGFKIGSRTNAAAVAVEALTFGRHTFIVRNKTGEIQLVGWKNGLKATQANAGGDGTPGGFAGHDLILTGGETQKSFIVSEASYEALLADLVA